MESDQPELDRTGTQLEEAHLIGGRYEVIAPIGSGGMGEISLVSDRQRNGARFALKMLYPHVSKNPKQVARFRKEAELLSSLTHPNIVRVYDFSETRDGRYFFTMELVNGRSLGKCLEDGEGRKRFEMDEILHVLRCIANALHFAHEHGVVHRDLKPDNVLLTEDGEVKVSDFGIARSLVEDSRLTVTGETVGTPYYMAPEQFRGSKVDHRADIYSLGILAFELASGSRPFQEDNFIALSAMHLTRELPRVTGKDFPLPAWFQDFVENCAEKNPADRFQSMSEVIEALDDRIGGRKASFCISSILRRLFSRK